jgi:hypothetical protein
MGCLLLLALTSGCEIGSTMFQMDSNSGQPFFGVDLLRSRKTAATARPVQPTKTAVVTQVRNTPGSPAQPVTMAAAPKTAEPSLLERLKLKRAPERVPLSLPAAEGETADGPAEEFR